ncbi:MAG: hypothetical protein OHK0029_39960 [Armatimonadaceae bacterium]
MLEAKEKQTPRNQRWEYHLVTGYYEKDDSNEDKRAFNEAGRAGWEAVCAYGPNGKYILFKRPMR